MSLDKKVIELFEKNSGRWLSEKTILNETAAETEAGIVLKILDNLFSVGYLARKRNSYRREDKSSLFLGRFSPIKGGGGFVIARDRSLKDTFIPSSRTKGAFSGDEVICRVKHRDLRPEGTIVHIVERSLNKIVGVVSQGRLIPFGESNPVRMESKSESEGKVALIELREDESGEPKSDKVEVIGDPYSASTVIKAVEIRYGLEKTLSRAAEKEADSFGETFQEAWLSQRRDLRKLAAITIDPVDAKDFDDAISVERENEGFRLFIHIADVSFFVKEKGALDAEARRRGNSVYLPGTVYPMLPFNLSNKLCSLNENEERLCVTAELVIDKEGLVKKAHFYDSVIRSMKRLSYEEAEEILDGGGNFDRKVKETVTAGHEAASLLNKKRVAEGALDFDLPEAHLSFAEMGFVEKVLPLPRLKSHRLIEEFMLLGNCRVAQYLEKRKAPFIHRIHEEPDSEKFQSILPLLNNLGIGSSAKGAKNLSKLIIGVLEKAKGKSYERLVSYRVLRTMMRARYSEIAGSHFGLALRSYCHFTSPIRRYPDLIVHRALKSVLKGVPCGSGEFPEIAAHSSETERLADEAEREALEWLTLIYLKEKLGDDFQAMITGFTKFGVRIELVEELIEGICPFSFLEYDHFIVDKNGFSARGKYTSKLLKVGQVVGAKLVKTDLFNKEAQFKII